MLSIILVIISIVNASSDTMEVKGMKDIYYRVFASNNNIYFQYKTDKSWTTPEQVGNGRYPCIALSSDGNSPWIFYVNRYYEDVFKCAIRRPDGTWKIRTIYSCKENERTDDYNVGPSMTLATISTAGGDLGYGVFSDNYDRIFFVAFDTIRNYGEPPYQVIDESYPCLASSISITPGDLLHVVWQRDIGDEGKIFYRTTEKVHPDDIRHDILPSWSEPFEISEPGYTAPASNPSTEAYGEYVYAAWRGPYDQNNTTGEIWRRARNINQYPWVWEDPRNISETQDNESNYPVMSTNFVTVWHEQVDKNNWDIWARFEPEQSAQPIFQTPNSSKYPHINGYWDPNPAVPPTFCCNTIWTEEIIPEVYEVRFGCYRYEYNPQEEKAPLYYAVEIGDSIASPYCVQRTGYLHYNPISIDYGNQKLKYKLPYLNPQYYYDLRAIVFHRGQNNHTQQFYIDSSLTRTVSYTPNRPETVLVRIPKATYERDAEILQEINRVLGTRAVIADLKLYQVEMIDSSGGGGGTQSAGITSLQRPSLHQSYPNPFKSQTAIRYSLTTPSKVSLTIYDISGRAVRRLLDATKEPGLYTISWNGRDDKGRTLAQGVYFYRLKTDGFSDTKRLVLIR